MTMCTLLISFKEEKLASWDKKEPLLFLKNFIKQEESKLVKEVKTIFKK